MTPRDSASRERGRRTSRGPAAGSGFISRLCIIGGIAAGLFSCAAGSDDNGILRMMRRIQTLVEKRDTAGISALISDDYRDFEGRDREATRTLIEGHFKEKRGIVVHLLGTEIAPGPVEGEAVVGTDVVLSSGAGFLLRKAVRFAGELFRFELRLRKTREGWRVVSARWNSSSRNDLSAESSRMLQELFPDL